MQDIAVDTELRDILQCCLSMDGAAADFYCRMAARTADETHKGFWEAVAQDEIDHRAYWEQLLARVRGGTLRNPFDHPKEVRAEFVDMRRRLAEMLDLQDAAAGIHPSVLFALRLEALMLHPAFALLFNGLEEAAGEHSPGREYQAHIDRFLEFVRRTFPEKPEMTLIAELLSDTYRRSRELARHIGEIRTLRGLIPICANCKNIREDTGYWEKFESYLARHGEIRFTHGICPACEKELYPELFTGKP